MGACSSDQHAPNNETVMSSDEEIYSENKYSNHLGSNTLRDDIFYRVVNLLKVATHQDYNRRTEFINLMDVLHNNKFNIPQILENIRSVEILDRDKKNKSLPKNTYTGQDEEIRIGTYGILYNSIFNGIFASNIEITKWEHFVDAVADAEHNDIRYFPKPSSDTDYLVADNLNRYLHKYEYLKEHNMKQNDLTDDMKKKFESIKGGGYSLPIDVYNILIVIVIIYVIYIIYSVYHAYSNCCRSSSYYDYYDDAPYDLDFFKSLEYKSRHLN